VRFEHLPAEQGLYDPRFEHDSCGVGFVCNIDGTVSHDIVKKGIEVLERLSHRGAVGADPETGDGAGILIQIPHKFFARECVKCGVDLPKNGHYGTGLVFLPTAYTEYRYCRPFIDVGIVVNFYYKNAVLGFLDQHRISRSHCFCDKSIYFGRHEEYYSSSKFRA